jgi:hypothetical protein
MTNTAFSVLKEYNNTKSTDVERNIDVTIGGRCGGFKSATDKTDLKQRKYCKSANI